jgi:hypothetical protein
MVLASSVHCVEGVGQEWRAAEAGLTPLKAKSLGELLKMFQSSLLTLVGVARRIE